MPRDAPVTVLANDQVSLRIQSEPIGALLAEAFGRRRHAARLDRHRGLRLAGFPLVDDVLGHVREQQGAIFPDGALGPVEPFGELLDLRVWRDQLIHDRLVDALDGADGRVVCRKAGEREEKQWEEAFHGEKAEKLKY